jgi:hypothetical protein
MSRLHAGQGTRRASERHRTGSHGATHVPRSRWAWLRCSSTRASAPSRRAFESQVVIDQRKEDRLEQEFDDLIERLERLGPVAQRDVVRFVDREGQVEHRLHRVAVVILGAGHVAVQRVRFVIGTTLQADSGQVSSGDAESFARQSLELDLVGGKTSLAPVLVDDGANLIDKAAHQVGSLLFDHGRVVMPAL